MKRDELIKNLKQNEASRSKRLSDASRFQNSLKLGPALYPLIFNSALGYAITKAK
jgi:hypothetical protein